MSRFGYRSGDRPASDLPRPPGGMCVDPAQAPTELVEPSMEPGQPPEPAAPVGWSCPRCCRVYAPWVPCCGTCGPQHADGRTEITEGPGMA